MTEAPDTKSATNADTDVVVVGARCAGSAAAIALARRGRRVVALDSSAFPSDTLSTHLFFPHHWAEIERLGALDRVRAIGAPEHSEAAVWAEDIEVRGPFNAVDGIAHGGCVRRHGLDQALVDTARDAGAEVRERVRVTELVRRADGRVAGVRYRAHDGEVGEIRARLVIGADGRKSTVANLVGATARDQVDNQRLMAFAYFRDPIESQRHVAVQWRVGAELGTVFPCDGGLALVLLMSPVSRGAEFRADPVATFESTIAAIPGMAKRLAGCERESTVKLSLKHPSYFRTSHGPGWALAGDAGHFKDPVIAQGIRDALRFGRLLGESVAPVLGDEPGADAESRLDAALAAWERRRDTECIDSYQWGNGLGLADDISPLEFASYRWFAARAGGATELLDVFSRRRRPDQVFTVPRVARWALDAARDPNVTLGELGAVLLRDVRRETGRRRARRAFVRAREVDAGQPASGG